MKHRHLRTSKKEAAQLFDLGYKEWKRNNLRSALKLFLLAANKGDSGAQLNVGYFYDKGIGVRPNLTKALYWYKRAYRRGDSSAANNIGTIQRDQQRYNQALAWFKRAVRLGNHGSYLEIAKHYLRNEQTGRAAQYLRKVCQSHRVAEVEVEEAKALLKKIRST